MNVTFTLFFRSRWLDVPNVGMVHSCMIIVVFRSLSTVFLLLYQVVHRGFVG